MRLEPVVRRLAGLLLVSAAAVQAAPSTTLRIGGAVEHPVVYDLGTLQALPTRSQTVSFQSGAGFQTHTYVGASTWDVLERAGVSIDPAIKNDALNRVVMVTGTDGYRSVFSLGELDPAFGNRASLLAHAEVVGGATVPLGSDGFVRVTAPGDVRGGRYVSGAVSVDVLPTGSTATGIGGGPSTSFEVTGAVTHSMRFDLAALEALPAVSVTIGADRYTGVSFWDLLDSVVGLQTRPDVKNDVLGMYVVATGSDGYRAAFSLGELSPSFGNEPDLIAFELNGAPLTDTGFARLVVPHDGKAGRWVSNLTRLEVFHASPVPEPAAWACFAVGLLLVGVRSRFGRR